MDFVRRSLAVCILFLSIGGASAHPHVWVIMKCKVIFDDSGSVVTLLYSWSFDEMTSAFTALGIKSRLSDPTREELAPAAGEQIASLRKVDFFTTMKVGNVSQGLPPAADYWLDFDGRVLTLYFSLPVNTAPNLTSMTIETYDPSYFVDMRFAEMNPVELVHAPSGCKSSIVRQTWTQTANRIVVACEGP
jgi:ABC-type uncharacterized transport system substrate-binding protein